MEVVGSHANHARVIPRRRRIVRASLPAALLVALLVPALPALAQPIGASESDGPTASSPTARERRVSDRAEPGAITFSEVPLGTSVTDQYLAQGVQFTSSAFTTNDNAATTNPVLSGSPKFTGPISARFTVPGTATPTTVNGFSLDLGYIDSRDSVELTYYDLAGSVLGAVRAQALGFNHLVVAQKGVASFSTKIITSEPAGYEVDNLAISRTATGIHPTRMASLGDSYSSGEGLVPDGGKTRYDCATDLGRGLYIEDTDVRAGQVWFPGNCDTRTLSRKEPRDLYKRKKRTYHNRCHRAGTAYPNQVRARLGVSSTNSIFVACSGAVTADINSVAQHGDPGSPVNVAGGKSQFDTVRGWAGGGVPDLITVGVGGNDAGFADIIKHCMVKACVQEAGWTDGVISNINSTVYDDLVTTYQKLRTAYPAATIAVFGYPDVIGDPSKDCAGVSPLWFHIEEEERAWVQQGLLPALNAAIADAATKTGVTYVDISQAMRSNGVCASDPWVNGVRLGVGDEWIPVASESFHPNQKGHAAITNWFMDYYTEGGRLNFSNPSPQAPIRPAYGSAIQVGSLDVQPVETCGRKCVTEGPCVRACPIQIQGSGFTPQAQLTLRLAGQADPRRISARQSAVTDLAQVVTDAGGRFVASVTLPKGIASGTYVVTASGAAGAVAQDGTGFVTSYAKRPAPVGPLLVKVDGKRKTTLRNGRAKFRCATNLNETAKCRVKVQVKAKVSGRKVKLTRKSKKVKLRHGLQHAVRVAFSQRDLAVLRRAADRRGLVKVIVSAKATAARLKAKDKVVLYLRVGPNR